MTRTLNMVTAERREDEVILRDNVIIAEMTAEYALELADQIIKHADKILLAHGNDN